MGAASALGQLNAGQSAKDAGDYNASQANMNAQLALEQAAQDQKRQQIMSGRVIGSERATVGASGTTAGGSAMDAIASNAAQAELDRLNIGYKGQIAATGFSNQAKLDTMQGNNAQTASYFGATSSLFSSSQSGMQMMAAGGA